MHRRQLLHQQVLRPVGVLVLVDHDVAELRRVALAHRLRLLEQLDGLEQQVVEVERAALLQQLDVARVDLGDAAPRGSSRRCRPSASGPSIRFLAWLMRDSASARLESACRRRCTSLQRLLDRRQLVGRVVDDEVARQADRRRLAAQQLARTARGTSRSTCRWQSVPSSVCDARAASPPPPCW